MITWEISKMFKSKNGAIACALFLLILGAMFFINPQSERSFMNGDHSIISEEDRFNQKIEQLEEMQASEGTGDFPADFMEITTEKLNAIESKEYQDVRFWEAFNLRATHPVMTALMFIIIGLLFSNIYTDEIVSGVDSLILSSKNKNKVLYSKLAISIGLPTALYAIYLAVQFVVTLIQYGKPLNGTLQAIRIAEIPLLLKAPYTIHEFILLRIGILLVIFVALSVLASLISFVSKNSIQSISGFLALVFAGKLLTMLKWIPASLLLIISKINFIDLIFEFNGFALMYLGKMELFSMNLDITNVSVAIIAIGLLAEIMLCRIVFKKFLTR